MKYIQQLHNYKPYLPPVRYSLQLLELFRAIKATSKTLPGIGVSSGTEALAIALEQIRSVTEDSRDEVIIPDFICKSVINAVGSVGLKPVLVPISSKSWFYQQQALLDKINKNTLALIVVSYFGLTPIIKQEKADQLCQALDKVTIIADWAQSFGVSPSIPRLPDPKIIIYSFGPGKSLPAGGGGMITSDDPVITEKLKIVQEKLTKPNKLITALHIIRLIGSSIVLSPIVWPLVSHITPIFYNKETYNIIRLRYSRLPDVLQRYIIANMKILDNEIIERRANANNLLASLENIKNIELPSHESLKDSACTRFPIVFASNEQLINCRTNLIKKGILCGGVSTWDSYNNGTENSLSISQRLLTIPTYKNTKMFHQDIKAIISEHI